MSDLSEERVIINGEAHIHPEAYASQRVPVHQKNTHKDPEIPETKVELFDGVKKVERISVFAMFRNNQVYLKYFFDILQKMEAYYDVQFSYFFIENDSKDKTRELLQEWMSGRRGKLLLGEFESDYKNTGENFERTDRLAFLRNTLADNATPLDTDWTLYIDSHIFFEVTSLRDMMAIQPAAQEIGMVTGNTRHVYTLGQLARSVGKNLTISDGDTNPNRLVDVLHYYDTFTFYDMDSRSYYPSCPFEGCRMCGVLRRHLKNQGVQFPPFIPPSVKVIEVKAAFGGFALIDSSVLNHPRIRWGTLPFDVTNTKSLCDHILFCDRMRTVTGKKVVVIQDITGLYRTY